jgi:hypothetical protein
MEVHLTQGSASGSERSEGKDEYSRSLDPPPARVVPWPMARGKKFDSVWSADKVSGRELDSRSLSPCPALSSPDSFAGSNKENLCVSVSYSYLLFFLLILHGYKAFNSRRTN